MSAITATPMPALGVIKVEIDARDNPTAKGVLLKRYPTGANLNVNPAVEVRGVLPLLSMNTSTPAENYVELSAGWAVFYDFEAPLDTPVTYTIETDGDTYATTGPNRVTNGDFEVNAAGWVGYQGYAATNTLARSTFTAAGWPVSGSASLSVTSTTANSFGTAYSVGAGTCTAGRMYIVSAAFFTALAGRNAELYVEWISAIGSVIENPSDSRSPTPNQPSYVTFGWIAPQGAVSFNVLVAMKNTAANEVFYLDNVTVYEVQTAKVAATISTSVTLASQPGIGWLKDPARPWANVKLLCDDLIPGACDTGTGVHFIGLAGRKFSADAQNFDVPGAKRGTVAYSVRKDFTSQLRLVTRAISDRDAIETLLASGAPLLLQLPAAYAEADQYISVGEVAEDRISADQRKPWRVFVLPYVVEDAPVGPAQALAGKRWRDLPYTTWADLKATGKSWDDLAADATMTAVDHPSRARAFSGRTVTSV